MNTFISQYIDALITTAGGIFCCLFGYGLLRVTRVPAPRQERAIKMLRVCGPILLLFGLLRFCMDQSPASNWLRYSTNDGVASAEFPAKPTVEEKTDNLNGIIVKWSVLTCKVPSKSMVLFLSVCPLSSNMASLSDADRFAAMKAEWIEKGNSVVHESRLQLGASSGYALELEHDGGKIRTSLRVACIAGKVYRVAVSSSGSQDGDAMIDRFLESFRVERTGG
jgi:hypothetical protein